MFSSVGRRLAVLNAAVVLGILALVSVAMFLFLQRSLQEEVDSALEDRAQAAQLAWAPLFEESLALRKSAFLLLDDGPESGDKQNEDREEGDEEAEEAAEDFVKSGDTIAFALAADGQVLASSRGVDILGLPNLDALGASLSGDSTFSDITIDREHVRVLTEPAYVDGRVAGAVQVAQGQGAYEAALRTVRLATLGGLALGALVALPAGLFLASRSMRPIRRAFEQQRAFVADASHELRTPLTVLRAQAEYLQRSPDLSSEEVVKGHQVIVNEVDAMSRLVNDLLLLARAEQAALVLELDRHDLTDVVRQATNSFATQSKSAGIELGFDGSGGIIARFDKNRVQQVVRILLDNAFAHTPGGGSINVSVRGDGVKGIISVTDTGSGIAPEDLPHVFDRFYRSRGGKSSSGGLGLGLAIAQTIVKAHGGEISAVSEPGRGATFWFTIPQV